MTRRASSGTAKSRPALIALVECSIKVSPVLARLIRKSAEIEAGGASAKDALLAAAGFQADELAILRQELDRVSAEANELREHITREQVQLGQARAILSQRDKDITIFRGDLRKMVETVKRMEQSIVDLKAQIAEQAVILERRDVQLAHSLSLLELDDIAAEAVTAFRNRLLRNESSYLGGTVTEMNAVIESLEQPEIQGLSKLLSRGSWRIYLIRWLLRVRIRK